MRSVERHVDDEGYPAERREFASVLAPVLEAALFPMSFANSIHEGMSPQRSKGNLRVGTVGC